MAEIADDNEVKKNLIFNREDLFKILTEPRIAKGEVVVVDENYGIRITDIVIPRRVTE